MIPWDDDLDILANNQTALQLINYLKTQTQFPEITWCKFQNFIKIFFKNKPKAGKKRWTFPFVDIFFFDSDKPNGKFCVNYKCAKYAEIFPLKLRPFGKFWLPTPKNITHHLQYQFIRRTLASINVDEICVKAGADHKNEKKLELNIELKCDLLKDSYQFVDKTCNTTHCSESLKLNGTTLYTVIFNNK